MNRAALTLLVLAGAVALLVWLSRPKKKTRVERPTATEALQILMVGNRRSMASRHACDRQGSDQRASTYESQTPIAVVLACSDSRTSPEYIFDQGIGDIFVVRVAGNVLDGLVMGSIQYALTELKVPLVMVLGHENCGAVKAALAGAKSGQSLPPHLVDITRRIPVGGDLDETIVANVHQVKTQLEQDQAIAPLLKELNGQVVAAEYHLHSGEVTLI